MHRQTRRWALGTAASAVAIGLASACAAPIFSKGTVRRAWPTLTVLAATAGSAQSTAPQPAWLAPLRAAIDHLNASQRDQLGATIALHTFTADQAPDALTLDSNGQVKRFNDMAYVKALARAVADQADVLGFAPIPAGAPTGDVPVTKLDLQVAGAGAARSPQPERAFRALRALEQALAPALLLSAIRPLAARRLKDGSTDPRLAQALGWGMNVGRASGADVLGADALFGLYTILPGTYSTKAPPKPPAEACAEVATLLRYRQVCGPVPAYCPAATP
jgi:hypothetical protein